MSIGVLLRGFIGDMMDFGDVILYTLFPSFMAIQACRAVGDLKFQRVRFLNWEISSVIYHTKCIDNNSEIIFLKIAMTLEVVGRHVWGWPVTTP